MMLTRWFLTHIKIKTKGANIMAKKQLTVRILVAISICGTAFEPNELVKGDEALLKPLEESGTVSSNKADIDYCEKELKAEVINLANLAASDDSNSEESDQENE